MIDLSLLANSLASDQGVVPLSSFGRSLHRGGRDVNDNAHDIRPVYYPEIMENSPKDVSVVQIEAFDPDSSSDDKLSVQNHRVGNPQGFSQLILKQVCVNTIMQK